MNNAKETLHKVNMSIFCAHDKAVKLFLPRPSRSFLEILTEPMKHSVRSC